MASPLFCLLCVSCLLNIAWSQGQAHITFDRELIYDKDTFVLKCSYPSYFSLAAVSLQAFNGTSEKGSMQCSVEHSTVKQTGVFNGSTVLQCPSYTAGSGYVGVTMQASPTLELNYNCTLVVNDGLRFFSLTSSAMRFELSVMPEPVFLNHAALNFNESDNVSLACYSRRGKPPAAVNLTVTQQEQSPMQAMGNVSAFLQLPQAKRLLNNATVTCTVTNHRFSRNMTYQGIVNINYLNVNKQVLYEVYTTDSSATLNCSASSNPPAVYSWKTGEIKGSFSPRNDSFVVPKHSSGVVNCTILNPATREQMVLTFDVKYRSPIIVILVTVIVIVCAAVVGVVIYLRCRQKSQRLARSSDRLPPVQEPCLNQVESAEDRQVHPESDRLKISVE